MFISDDGTKMNRAINYIGWLGHKNLGNEALFYRKSANISILTC